MSSSTFEVTEAENEAGKDLNFGLEACEENGITLSAQVDGEVQKDHTYTKDPDDTYKEEENLDSQQEESETTDNVAENHTDENIKILEATNLKTLKIVSSKRGASSSKKFKAKKDVLTEESNKSEENSTVEPSEEKKNNEEQPKSLKRGRKRKVEEKENVIDRSIVEEVQSINESDSIKEKTSSEIPVKKKNEKSNAKKARKSVPAAVDGDVNQNLPEGWVRKVVVRKSGKTAGQFDIYIYSPDGIKFRSRPDIAAYLARTKSNLKLEDFNFSKKKISEDSVSNITQKKDKLTSAVKPKSLSEKRKAKYTSASKKAPKLLVKLNFTPKNKKGKSANAKKVSNKQVKQTKDSLKKVKASGSSSKVIKKKKTG